MDTADEEKLIQIRRSVGMVFQNPDNQIVANVVEEDVGLRPEKSGRGQPEIRRRVELAPETGGHVGTRWSTPRTCSPAGRSSALPLRASLPWPLCIVLDEPTAMLDPKGRRKSWRPSCG